MGQKSTKEHKNIYFTSREDSGLTREAAVDKMDSYISRSKLEKIEYDKSIPHPDEVLAMAECYGNPVLCNYYCSHDCEIGKEFIPEVQVKELSQITVEMLAVMSTLRKERDRFLEITVDGEITEDEMPDFLRIQEQLNKMSLAVDSLKLWVNNTVASGKIDKSLLKKK